MPYHRAGLGKAMRLGLPPQDEFEVPDKALMDKLQLMIENGI